MIFPILGLAAASFLISWLLTALMIRIAPRIGFVDKPGHRKIHDNPKPLGGGVAIFLAFTLTMLAVVVAIYLNFTPGNNLPNWPAYVGGLKQQTPLAIGLILAMLIIHILGLIDDRKALGPYLKLIVQLAVAAALVIEFKSVRALTALGPAISITLTVLWIVAITNAFNFLDNMDGLSSGVAAVCTTAFFITTIQIQQWFVAASLAILLGAILGFLWWNFPPAKIFMGDSGSLLIGFVLGVLTVRTTYLPKDASFA